MTYQSNMNRRRSYQSTPFNGAGGYQAAQPGASHPHGYVQPATAPVPASASFPPSAPEAPIQEPKRSDSSPRADSHCEISQKIHNVFGRNKVIDFVSILSKAHLQDFANIHGRIGSGYAPNSTIGFVICDTTKGKGDNSVTVKFSVDVRDMEILLEAAKMAYFGKLEKPSLAKDSVMAAMSQLDGWTSFPPNPDGSRTIPCNHLNALYDTLANGLLNIPQPGEPLFSYTKEKNNPSKVNPETGLGPVAKLIINYCAIDKQGRESNYPWFISIENFLAKVERQSNGTTTHKSSTKTNSRSAFINLSKGDFYTAMIAVDRFVRLWEARQMGPVMDEAYQILENNIREICGQN